MCLYTVRPLLSAVLGRTTLWSQKPRRTEEARLLVVSRHIGVEVRV